MATVKINGEKKVNLEALYQLGGKWVWNLLIPYPNQWVYYNETRSVSFDVYFQLAPITLIRIHFFLNQAGGQRWLFCFIFK